jgi:hypothetical protein
MDWDYIGRLIMFGSGKDSRSAGRTSATGSNGNVRDSQATDGRHAAFLGGHSAAVNDLRPVRHTGRHRAE